MVRSARPDDPGAVYPPQLLSPLAEGCGCGRVLDDGVPLSVTVGIATYPDGDVSRADVLRIADEALYAHERVSG